MKKISVAGLGMCALALAFAAKDPVIMRVNGVDVPKSEFEYLYNKNSQQQINPQSLDEYVEMFKLYKMKVADARAEGIDTTAAFLKETEQYRHDLAAPYLADSVYLNSLVREAYDRSQQEVEAYHIMVFKNRDGSHSTELRQRADSILTALKGGADFAEMARTKSQDRGSSVRDGRMGWITAGQYPLEFELEAWKLPEGAISEKVVETPVGYHILKGGKHRPARGKVRVSHILKLTQGKDEAGKARARQEIDSLYNVVLQNPVAFPQIASEFSDDKASARQGGALPFFGAGEMVEPFDSASFALGLNEMSGIVESPFGYHIIFKTGEQPVPSLSEIKPVQLQRMQSPKDPRYKLIRQNQIRRFAKKHKASLNERNIAALREAAASQGVDSAFVAAWSAAPRSLTPVFTVDGRNVSAGELVSTFGRVNVPASPIAVDFINDRLETLYSGTLTEAEEAALDQTQPDYHNLLREYVDGSLLYEVSVRKVWDKAAKDTEGLKRYFEANRDNYKWTEPHAKGFLVQTVNDSVASAIRSRAAELPEDELVNTIRKEFKGDAAIDRVLVSKGTNAVVDYLVFGGEEVKPTNAKFTEMFMINPRIISEPEEVNDVRGLVTSDYQNEHQAEWEKELRQKYPVTVDEKVLRKVKSIK